MHVREIHKLNQRIRLPETLARGWTFGLVFLLDKSCHHLAEVYTSVIETFLFQVSSENLPNPTVENERV